VLQTARSLKAEVQKKKKIKESVVEKTKERWHGKRMHGQLPRNVDEKLMDIEQLYRWLKSGDIKGETESTTVAAQDQEIRTNYFKNKILNEKTESKCRLCKQHGETIDRLTSGCPILAKNEYLMRRDKFCSHYNYYYYYYYYYYKMSVSPTDQSVSLSGTVAVAVPMVLLLLSVS
jgi:hypothetical protein